MKNSVSILLCLWLIEALTVSPQKLLFDRVYVEFGTNIGPHVSTRIRQHLESVPQVRNVYESSTLHHMDWPILMENESMGALFVSFGNATTSLQLIPVEQVQQLDHEGFRMVGEFRSSGIMVIGSNGRPLDPTQHTNVTFNKDSVHYGAVVAAYAVLERLGFGFLHPLDSYTPPFLSLSKSKTDCTSQPHSTTTSTKTSTAKSTTTTSSTLSSPKKHNEGCEPTDTFDFDVTEEPYWPERSFHIHTQHPLEITDVLQGHDIPQTGMHGPHCAYFSTRNRPHQRTWLDAHREGSRSGGVDGQGQGLESSIDPSSDFAHGPGLGPGLGQGLGHEDLAMGHGPRRSNSDGDAAHGHSANSQVSSHTYIYSHKIICS